MDHHQSWSWEVPGRFWLPSSWEGSTLLLIGLQYCVHQPLPSSYVSEAPALNLTAPLRVSGTCTVGCGVEKQNSGPVDR